MRSVLLLQRRAVAFSLLLFALGGCNTDRREPGGDSPSPSKHPSSQVPSTSPETGAAAEKRPPFAQRVSDDLSGPSYLIVIGSWKLGNAPQEIPEELKNRRLESIRTAPGFPRLAQPEETQALRPGYGALLAGICNDKAQASSVLRSLETEGVDGYLKESPRRHSNACPLPNERWLLGHELILAVESDNPNSTERVKDLLDRGAPTNHGRGSSTPLSIAAYNNDTVVARLLLAHGATVNIPDRAPQEESILEIAIRSPYGDPLEMVKLLVAHGADIHAKTEGAEADPGSTVQIAAIRQCRPQVLEFLYAKGAKGEAVSEDEICRDRHPPEAPDTDRTKILRLMGRP